MKKRNELKGKDRGRSTNRGRYKTEVVERGENNIHPLNQRERERGGGADR